MFFRNLIICLILIICSCGLPSEPKPLLESFLKAMQSGNFKIAISMATDSARANILSIESISKYANPDERVILTGIPEGTINISKEDIQKDIANYEYTVNDSSTDFIRLVKKDGVWKVDFQARKIYPN